MFNISRSTLDSPLLLTSSSLPRTALLFIPLLFIPFVLRMWKLKLVALALGYTENWW